MTDLSDAQRVERMSRAKRALEEFIEPAFDAAHNAYFARLKDITSRSPWETAKIAALANACRVLEEVHSQVCGLIHDGEHAKSQMIRAEKIEQLSPAKAKWARWAPL